MPSRRRRIRIRLPAAPAATALLLAGAATTAVGGPDDAFSVAAWETQLDVGEHADVAAKAEGRVAVLEARYDRYHPTLVEPLRLLGDARLGLGDADGALAAYDRAKHVVRIHDGVQGLAQLPLLYREAAALAANGDRGTANDRHEFAYSLKLRAYGAGDPRLVPGLRQLIDWYLRHYKYRPAQVLYQQVLDILRRHHPPDDPRIVAALAAYADSFRAQRFGVRLAGRGGFQAWPPGHAKDPPWYGKSGFLRGRSLMREVVALTEAAAHTSAADRAKAVVTLADWHLLHYESGAAMHHYRHAWRLLETEPALRAELFEKPTPLNLRLPNDPALRADLRDERDRGGRVARDGVVRLALAVTHRGNVVGRRTLAAEPRNLMEFKVRRAAKRTRYRPLFKDGDPAPRRGLELEFRYRYYPGDSSLLR